MGRAARAEELTSFLLLEMPRRIVSRGSKGRAARNELRAASEGRQAARGCKGRAGQCERRAASIGTPNSLRLSKLHKARGSK